MLWLENISLSPGVETLLTDANWQINPKDRIGLIGRNGVGKTALIRCMVNEELPLSGKVKFNPNKRIGYLPQKAVSGSNEPLWDEARAGMTRLNEAEKKFNAAIAKADKGGEKAEEIRADAMEQWRMAGGYRRDETIGETLHGLGFHPSEWQKNCNSFSGGWQMRIALAKLLLSEPDLAILDEPTNHLDLHARSWLATHLSKAPYAVLVVSHDRVFLDRAVTSIVEIRNRKLHRFSGNYTTFEKNRDLRILQEKKSHEKNKAERDKLERFVQRFGAKANKAAQAQSKQKRLDKMEVIEAPTSLTPPPTIKIACGPPSASVAFELKKATIGWNRSEPLLENVDLNLERGMRLALIGSNGSGKSTLLKTLSAQIGPLAGLALRGENIRLGRYDQDIAQALPADSTPIEAISEKLFAYGIEEIRSALGAMGLQSNAHTRLISQLSGGEKARVALALLSLGKHNCLFLDEPTNHLDVETAIALGKSLKEYPGAILLISHDVGLIKATATHIGAIADKRLLVAEGVPDHMLEPKPVTRATEEKNTRGAIDFADQKKRKNRIKKLKSEIDKAEGKGERQESALADIESLLMQPGIAVEDTLKLSTDHDLAQNKLSASIEEWERLCDLLEGIEST